MPMAYTELHLSGSFYTGSQKSLGQRNSWISGLRRVQCQNSSVAYDFSEAKAQELTYWGGGGLHRIFRI